MKIDAYQHCEIQRSPEDPSVDGATVVQARQSLLESQWLLASLAPLPIFRTHIPGLIPAS